MRRAPHSLVVLALLGASVSLPSYADSIVLRNGSTIYGEATVADGIVTVDFGARGRISMPERDVEKIVENDLDAFTPPDAATLKPAAASESVIVRMREGADRLGRGIYVGETEPSADERMLRLRLPEGGAVEILRDQIATVEKASDAPELIHLTHGVAAPERGDTEGTDGAEPEAPVTITTKHRIELKNGRILRGTVIARPEHGPIVVELGDLGVVELRPGEIASITDEEATILVGPSTGETGGEGAEGAGEPSLPVESPIEALREEIREQVLRDLLDVLLEKAIDERLPASAYDFSLESIHVDSDLAEEILYWVRELGRQRNQNRTRAERHLKEYGAAVLPFLGGAVHHPLDLTRRAAMRIIRDVGDVRGAPLAIRSLDDRDAWVRRLAHEALAALFRAPIPFEADAPPAARERAQNEYQALWENLTVDELIRSLNRGQLLPRE